MYKWTGEIAGKKKVVVIINHNEENYNTTVVNPIEVNQLHHIHKQ
jgi:hypothetical protein